MDEPRMHLSLADVDRLLQSPTPEVKIETATRILADISEIRADPKEMAIAKEIIERLAQDAELAVRQGVAWQIAHSPMLSHELAAKMARDVASVAFPILRYARLQDDVLIEVCREKDSRKTLAIAGRKHLPAKVADAVIESSNVKAIAVLMGNSSARVSDDALLKVLVDYGNIPAVNIPMSHRSDLPAQVVEQLVGIVSTGIRNQLIEAYNITPEVANALVQQGREVATVVMLKPIARNLDQLEPFVKSLMESNQVTPTFLFRSLCAGEINLFRTGLAARGKLPLIAIDELLRDRGPLGLPALLRRCDIPMSLLPAYKAAITVWRDSGFSGGETGLSKYQSNVIAAVFEDCVSIDEPELDDLLQHLFTPGAAEHNVSLASASRN